MIDELREYVFKKTYWDMYWPLFEDVCLPTRRDDYGVLRGLWSISQGDEVRFIHLWRYASLDDRAQKRAQLMKVDAWRNDFLPRAAPHITRQFLQVLNPVVEASSDELAGACYQHTYNCSPGGAGGVIEQLKAAKLVEHGGIVGVWSTEFSDPNQVIVISTSLAAPIDQTGKITEIFPRILKPIVVGKQITATELG